MEGISGGGDNSESSDVVALRRLQHTFEALQNELRQSLFFLFSVDLEAAKKEGVDVAPYLAQLPALRKQVLRREVDLAFHAAVSDPTRKKYDILISKIHDAKKLAEGVDVSDIEELLPSIEADVRDRHEK
jgi:hypothetical protein